MTSSSPFLMDDQADADFFDKLVDDDDDYQVSKCENSENNNSIGSAEIEPDVASGNNTSDALSKLMLDKTEDNNKAVLLSSEREDSSVLDGVLPIDIKLTKIPNQINASIIVEGHNGEDGLAEGHSGEDCPAEGHTGEYGPAEDFLSVQKQLSFEGLVKEQVVMESAEISFTKSGNNEEVDFSFSDTDDRKNKGTDSLDSKQEQTRSKNICTNAREVQWSNFNTTSAHSDLGGFGSYSDFYTDFLNTSTQQAGNSGLDFFSTVNHGSAVQQISDSTPYQTSQVLENGTLDALVATASQPQVNSFFESKPFNGHTNDVQNQFNKGELEGHFTSSVSPDQSNFTGDSQVAYYNQWENAYPGWRYDYATGEWYQVEEYETTAADTSTVEGANRCGSQYNLQTMQSSVSYSRWQTQGSQIYLAQSAGVSDDQVESINTDVNTAWGHGSVEQAVPNWQQEITTSHSQNAPHNQENVYYDPQYPGWYYDLVGQEWRQVADYGRMDHGQSSQISGASEVSTCDGQQTLRWSASSKDNPMSNGQWGNSISQENMYDSNQARHGGVLDDNLTGEKHNDTIIRNMSTVYNPAADIQGKLDQPTNFNASNLTVFNPAASVQGPLDNSACFHVPNSAMYNPGASTQGQFNQASNFHVPNSDHGFSSHHSDISFQYSNSGQNVNSYSTQQMDQNKGSQVSDDYYRNIQPADYSHQMYQARQHANHTPLLNSAMEGRSSEGRPPHALVTFGFGGKIVVFHPKNNLGMASSCGSQDSIDGVITVHSIGKLVKENSGNRSGEIENSYFDTLCGQAFSSPLVGGSVASKEIFKWIDERITNSESATTDFANPEFMHMLLCSLKIFCQHYGKFRSAFGSGGASQEIDGPEAALTKLFSSTNSTGYGLNKFGVVTQCLQTMPSESQLQSTALEMKNLLVAGKRKEALLLAQQGQLWGPALVLAWQLGQQFYVDTVKLMAQQQFLPGTPLRTLCLILAGQPAEVFSTSSSAASSNSHPGKVIGRQQSDQDCMSGMLNDWKENLAIIVANRTQGDERVIVHLGDCLWKERGEVAAAHTCYLVAEANFEYFSDCARLCLIGADHWKFPRTFTSPEAIQRTELYEYAKLLGNPQYILLPFQPYKLIYAQMLAEVGKVSDSLRYCQAVSKILKNAGRAPEVEACRQLASSLEERLRIHTQGGYSSNLAPSKLVGRLITTIDRGIHKIIGAPPPPMPSDSQTSLQNGDSDSYSTVPKVANASPHLIATPLMPSASMEPISEWTGNNSKGTMQTRSVSEPNFIRSPQENQSSFPNLKAESSPSKAHGNASTSGGQSRFGRFGAQIFQKAVGLIAKAHHNEAKLGEKNKFRYDEKLKRWVEEGAAPPPEEPALSAPPTSAAFISNSKTSESGYNIGSALNGQNGISNGGSESRRIAPSEQVSGMPPVPPSMNQFSARNRLQGVRSRYVDTFNKSGGTTPSKSFNSPVIPAARPGGLPAGANFFVPTPASFDSNSIEAADISEENSLVAACTSMEDIPNGPTDLCSESSGSEEKFPKGASSIQRFSSADNVAYLASKGFSDIQNRSVALSSHSRAASWSGEYPNSSKNTNEAEALSTPDRNQFSRISNVSGYFSYPTKLDAQKPGSGGYGYSTLPSPPSIEPQHSSTAIKKSLVADRGSTDRMYNPMDYGLQTGFQGDGFGDELQEVAL